MNPHDPHSPSGKSLFPFGDEPTTGAPDWFVTYADMMSLLLTFFIMLAAMSELKSDPKVVQAVESMQKQFGREGTGAGLQLRGPRAAPTSGVIPSGRQAPLGGRIYFAEDSAMMSDDERIKLRLLQEQFQGKLQRIEVRGHTTRRPMPADSAFHDHWELAFARCRAVAEQLTALGIDPRRIRLGVAGGNEPAATGDDPVARRENSRVEVFLLNEYNDDRETVVFRDPTNQADPE